MSVPGSAETHRIGALLVAVSVVAVAACESGPATAGVDGSPRWVVGAEPTTVVGRVEGDPAYLFSDVTAGVLLPDGGIAVADADAGSVRVFSPQGDFVRALGRKGEGPGEFEGIRRVELLPPDTLLIHDSGLLRLTRYLVSGELVSTVGLRAADGYPEMYLGRFSDGEYAFGWIRPGPRDASTLTPDAMRFARFDAAGGMSGALGSIDGMERRGGGPRAFSPHPSAAVVRDSLFVTRGLPAQIEVRDREGRTIRTIPVPLQPPDADVAWAALDSTLAARADPMELRFREDQVREGDIPPFALMAVDDRGLLWLKRYDPRVDSHLLMTGRGRGGSWIVLDRSGAVRAEVELPAGFLLLDVRDGRVLGQTRDELGVERVEVRSLGR